MQLSDFDFTLPKELIAEHPVYPRHNSRMLVVGNEFYDKKFLDLSNYLTPNDLIIMNNSKVIPALLHGMVKNRSIELNLHKMIESDTWLVFAKKTKYLSVGDLIHFTDSFTCEILEINGGELKIKFNKNNTLEEITKIGKMPIPPYIKRSPEGDDLKNYQTCYAKVEGSVAAPTAGLHFSEDVFESLKKNNIKHEFITLHVGAGTFLPVKTENIKDHKMHLEYYSISAETAATINETRKKGGKILAVGTTSLRVLETVSNESGMVTAGDGETGIFIYPGYKFKIVDMLLTNFHLPKSTLFMLVSAFSGTELMKKAYQHAIEEKYRFYSYGDCCLLTRD